MSHQAEVEKYATGCDGLSPFTSLNGTRTDVPSAKSLSTLSFSKIKVASINVRTLQDEMKLVTVIEAAKKCKIDVLAMQETRILGFDDSEYEDKSICGWKLVWSGLKRKKMFGVAILMAPHVRMINYTEHLRGRIISSTIYCKGLKLHILNVYSPTNDAKVTAKAKFYSPLNKAKNSLDEHPSHKVITLGDLMRPYH